MSAACDIVVVGALGRLGSAIAREARTPARGARVVGAVSRRGRGELPADVLVEAELRAVLDALPARVVTIDASTPGSTVEHLRACIAKRSPLLVATTGLQRQDEQRLVEASVEIPILVAANLSFGVQLLSDLVGRAAAVLAEADCEIVETHHNKKQDAPSGTALLLYRNVKEARGTPSPRRSTRDGQAPREPGEVGVLAVRGGDVVGEHVVSFFLEGERVELAHRATDRAVFARGALRAARFLARQAEPGLFTMKDVVEDALQQALPARSGA